VPQFLIRKLKREYPGNDSAVYGTLNNMGAMHGSKETAKGRAMDAKHRVSGAAKFGSNPFGDKESKDE